MFFPLRRAILSGVKPVSEFIGTIHMPYSRKLLTGKDYYAVKKLLRPGDVILSMTRGEFANFFIPDFWSHGAIFVRDYGVNEESVVEATSKGVVETDLVSFITSKDYIAIFRPIFLSERECINACKFALSCVGAPYDWLFEYSESNNKAFYCFELVACAYEEARKVTVYDSPQTDISNSLRPVTISSAIKISEFTPREYLGMRTVIGSDFVKAVRKFDLIHTTHEPTRSRG